MPIDAAILSIGDELLSGVTLDTNTSWIASELASRGVVVIECRALPDDRAAIAKAISELSQVARLLFVTGGLGPTADDLTREALADVISPGEPLQVDDQAMANLKKFFEGRDRPMSTINEKQATKPRGATLLTNPHGTAPGIRIDHNGSTIIAMPGVPREMRPMFDSVIVTVLDGDAASAAIVLRQHAVHIVGLSESTVAETLGDLLARDQQPGDDGSLRVGTTSSRSIVSVRIYARGTEAEVEESSRQVIDEVKAKCWPYVFGVDEESLAMVVGDELLRQGKLVTTIESCTGGMVGELLTDVPGSSAWYAGGWVTYTNQAKSKFVDVDAALIEEFGAVSHPVAAAMAVGGLKCTANDADLSIAVTGIAGPGGGSESKPVGTVFIACANRERIDNVTIRKFRFAGDRSAIRRWAALTALQMVRFELLKVARDVPLLREITSQQVALAFGSNLGNRQVALNAAIARLGEHPEIEVLKVSSFYETNAIGPGDQPDYLNASATIKTTLQPRALLDICLKIEREIGRDRSREERWGPRVIDLDILLYGMMIVDQPGLTIPHPRLHEREFVLKPLAEIASDWKHPVMDRTIEQLAVDL